MASFLLEFRSIGASATEKPPSDGCEAWVSSSAMEDSCADRKAEGVVAAECEQAGLGGRAAAQRLSQGLATQALSRAGPQPTQVAIQLNQHPLETRFAQIL